MSSLIRLDIFVSEDDLDLATGLVARHVHFGWEELSQPTGETCLRVHSDNLVLMDALIQEIQALLPHALLEREEVTNQDWTAAWRDFFTPVEAGRFVVLPPWLKDTPLHGKQPIVIEPKSAFGTGHHATTVICLKALSTLLDAGLTPETQVLDLGTGTGVLGIACATHGLNVVGTDIDPVAVTNAQENILLNAVQGRMQVLPGSTEAVAGQTFDLILANILAAPLRELAQDIMALLKPGGYLVLSGILGIQADSVAACYTALGVPQRLEDGDWAGLVWQPSKGSAVSPD